MSDRGGPRVLVTAASRHGATHEIAEAIGRGLVQRGVTARVVPAEDVRGIEGFDAFVFGSAVYMGHWLSPVLQLIEENDLSDGRRIWLFSSGPIGSPDPMPHEEAVDVTDLMERTDAREHKDFAGKIDKHALGFRERALVAALRVPEGDFRDWDAIDAWSAEIADAIQGHDKETA
jgi:menaquinone-dependent protoporphyrinogen oxidase